MSCLSVPVWLLPALPVWLLPAVPVWLLSAVPVWLLPVEPVWLLAAVPVWLLAAVPVWLLLASPVWLLAAVPAWLPPAVPVWLLPAVPSAAYGVQLLPNRVGNMAPRAAALSTAGLVHRVDLEGDCDWLVYIRKSSLTCLIKANLAKIYDRAFSISGRSVLFLGR